MCHRTAKRLCRSGERVLIAIGSNRHGPLGDAMGTIEESIDLIRSAGIVVLRRAPFYRTAPVGLPMQPSVCNTAILCRNPYGPTQLLHILKWIERVAGRSSVQHSQARTLDLDIIDHGNRVIGWPVGRRQAGRLILPHPYAHLRAFVLVPIADVAPSWFHPALGLPLTRLLKSVPRKPGSIEPWMTN